MSAPAFASTLEPKKPKDNIDHLRDILSVDTILDDINQEQALEFLEAVAIERQELLDELKELDEKVEIQEDADSLIKKLKDESINSDQASDLLDIVEEDNPELIYDFVKSKGYAYVKIDSMVNEEKLRAFIEKEIYPRYADQVENIMF
jgi:hypothetical protein